jgi:Bacterial alpha-L-rhamnosidase 6 hairpin glycosidase domain
MKPHRTTIWPRPQTALSRSGRAATLVTAAALLLVAAGTAAPSTAFAQSSSPKPWDRYNLSPASRTVHPRAVYRTTGTVSGAGNLLHSKATRLSGSGSSITLDFGQEVGGLVSLHFAAGTDAGSRLGLAFTESSQYVGTSSDASNGGGGPDGAIYAPAEPKSSWTMPPSQLRGGFRYLTLFTDADSAATVTLDGVSLAISFAPSSSDLRDYANHFLSSDPELNRIWYAGAYTVQTDTIAPTTGRVWGPPDSGWNNSATVGVGDEVLVDGAKRDRTVWPGDLGVAVPTEFASLGDLTPTRNALTTLYDHQAASGELPWAGPQVSFYGSDTYHLWTLIGTASYYQYTHDRAWLAGVWSKYVQGIAYSLAKVDSSGLMTVTGTADWARSDQGGQNLEANALLYRALVTASQLATLEGDSAHAASWAAAASSVAAAVNATLWDDAAGQYRDNPTSDLHPQDGNSLAVWYRIASAGQAKRISAGLTTNWNSFGATTPENGGQISTFPGSMEIQAHLQAGDTNQALELIRREWGYMLDSPLGTGSTFWEGYLADGQFGYGGAYMSTAHGWATGPTSALTFYVLGIRPSTTDDGYVIAPQTGDLTGTQGSLRTPFGTINLAWTHNLRSKTFTEQLDAPAGALEQVDVPTFGARTQVRVNGRLAWNGTRGMAFGARLEGGNVVLTSAPNRAGIVSQAIAAVPTTLAAAVTSTTGTPVLAGQSDVVPVTVSATGDRVVTGTVTAAVPTGWSATPAAFSVDTRGGPASTVVNVTVHAAADTPGGPKPITFTATSGRLRASTDLQLPAFGAWPAATTAVASTAHAPNVFNGATRTYDAGNAIDQNLATFWNDNTPGQFPDTLTITAPAAVTLAGVGFASIVDGVPTDFTVQTWDGTDWVTQATVSGNSALYRWIPFPSPVTSTQVRVVVNGSQTQNGNFTRIGELTP